MKPIEKLNNGDSIIINLFGKEKSVKVFSTGDNRYDESGHTKADGFALSEEEIFCLNWFIDNVKIEDYRQAIVRYCNEQYEAIGGEPIAESDIENEIAIFAIAVSIRKITQSRSGFVYPEISFFGDCECDPEHGICIGFGNKKFLGIGSQDWTL
ncbi:MAG: hypothetical protein NC543_10220 [bacterium]|nr:hypothetical protein [bacterium]MCM1374308.1 hypothetical protein [Muribaculum sp.]